MVKRNPEAPKGVHNGFAVTPGQNADSATKQLFKALVNDEEDHLDEFDKQLDNSKRFGPNYFAQQSFKIIPPEVGGEA